MSGSDESSHIPPYPMKLAPPDNRDVDPDTQVSEVCTIINSTKRKISTKFVRCSLFEWRPACSC